jgi:hypothetical protein
MIDGIRKMILLRFIGSRRAKNSSGNTLENAARPVAGRGIAQGLLSPPLGGMTNAAFEYAERKRPASYIRLQYLYISQA